MISGDEHHRGEPERPQGQPVVLQHVPAGLRRSSRCSSARSSSSTPSRSSSPSAAASWRCCAPSAPSRRQVLGSVLFEAVLVGLVASTVGLRRRHLASPRAEGAARPARPRHPGRATSPSLAAAIIWSFVLGMVVTVVAAIVAGARAARGSRPIAAMRDVAASTARARRRGRASCSGSSSPLVGIGAPGRSACSATAASLYVGLGMGCRLPRRRDARPDRSRRRSARRSACPIQKFKGITGQLAGENAMRNPKRTSATAAALDDRRGAGRAHHRLRGLGEGRR